MKEELKRISHPTRKSSKGTRDRETGMKYDSLITRGFLNARDVTMATDARSIRTPFGVIFISPRVLLLSTSAVGTVS